MGASFVRPGWIYRAIFLAAGLFVFIDNFALFSPILLSFFLILLITLALNPVIMALRGLIRRSVAAMLLALVFLGALAATAWAFYSPLKEPLAKFLHRLPDYWRKLDAPLHNFEQAIAPAALGPSGPVPAPDQGLHIDIQQILSGLGPGVHAVISNTAVMSLVALTVFVGVAYMLLNPRPVFAAFFALVPEPHQPAAARIGRRMVEFVPRWALALVTGMATIGVLVFLAMWPILGLENAALMGVIAFAFETIPYVGAVLAGIPALLLALGMDGGRPLWVVIAYVTIQLLEHNVINPLVVAGPLRQHPVAVIFAVMLCLAAFGILGVLLAVPMVETIAIVYDELYRPRYLPHTTSQDLDRMVREMFLGHRATPAPRGNGHPVDVSPPQKRRA